MHVRLFTQEEFVKFVLDHVAKGAPTAQIKAIEGPGLPFEIAFEGYTHMNAILNLHTMWTVYAHTNDLNSIIEGINAHIKGLHYCRYDPEKLTRYERDSVFPTLRTPNENYAHPGAGEILQDRGLAGLHILFCDYRDGLAIFLQKELLNPQEQMQWRDIAYENLRKKGWVRHRERFAARHDQGNIEVYTGEKGYPSHVQFLLPEMTKAHLPPSYLVAFPGVELTVVYCPPVSYPIKTARNARQLAFMSGWSSYVWMLFDQNPRPLSRTLYWINGSDKVLLNPRAA